jgi:DGQHR domain-containing protein
VKYVSLSEIKIPTEVPSLVGEKRDFGIEFEEEVKVFLEEKLKLSDVRGGAGFHIAPKGHKNQIDVCGRYKEVLFVFECKAAGRKTKKSLRKDILATKEKARMVLKGYKDIPEYSACKYVKFIFITKKIDIPETEKALLTDDEEPHFWYTDEHILEYYSDLYEKIGEFALFDFLADFGIRPSEEEFLNVAAVKAKIGEFFTYTFYANPKELLKFSYVARRRSQKEKFYQRMLDHHRIKKIQKFLDSGGIFPTNVIVSLRSGENTFESIGNFKLPNNCDAGILRIKNSYAACWIIDGQHRLYSHARSTSTSLIPCIAFEGISIEDERRFFLEINKEQKPIQPDLIWDLEGLSNPDSYRGIISNIVRTINNREPFLDKIYIPVKGSKSNKLVSMAAFCNGISNASLTKQITGDFKSFVYKYNKNNH